MVLSRPILAEPPAESPSTMKISHLLGSFSWQSASFPGREAESSTLLRLVSSRALRAASRARLAVMHFSTMVLAWAGFSARYSLSLSATAPSTRGRMSALPSFVLVWPSNWGSSSFTEMMAVKPSRMSSPERGASVAFKRLNFLA